MTPNSPTGNIKAFYNSTDSPKAAQQQGEPTTTQQASAAEDLPAADKHADDTAQCCSGSGRTSAAGSATYEVLEFQPAEQEEEVRGGHLCNWRSLLVED